MPLPSRAVIAAASCLVLHAFAAEETWPPPQPLPQAPAQQRSAAPRTLQWSASTIAASPLPSVLLSGPDKLPVASVSVPRMKAVLAVQQKIEQQAGVAARLLLQDGRQPNALSTPGPQGNLVALNLGMLDFIGDDENEYAAVLGHEYAHLALRHRAAREQREQLRSGLSTVLGLALGLVGVPMGGSIASLGTSAVSNIYSRDEEREADEAGLRYAAQAGFDPGAAVRLWKRMAARASGSIPFLSTHPAPQERVENLTRLSASLAASPPITVDAVKP